MTALEIIVQAKLRDFGIDQRFHVAYGVESAEVEVTAIHERAGNRLECLVVIRPTVDHSPFDQGVTFPIATVQLVVVFERGKTERQCPTLAEGPQAHIHAIHETVGRSVIEKCDQAFAEAVEILLVR